MIKNTFLQVIFTQHISLLHTLLLVSMLGFFIQPILSEDELPLVLPEGILNTLQNLTEWAVKEETIYNLAKVRLQRLKTEMRMLEKYIQDYKETSEQSIIHSVKPLTTPEERGRFIASSGTSTYRMVYRYATHLAELRGFLSESDHQLQDFLRDSAEPVNPDDLESPLTFMTNGMTTLPSPSRWPSLVEVNDVMLSLLHIHDVYDFPLEQLPAILSIETSHPTEFTAFHCAQIGLYALAREAFAWAIDWLEYGRNKIVSEDDTTMPLLVIDNYLALAVKIHNEAFHRLPLYDVTVFNHNISRGSDEGNREKRRTVQYDYFKGEKADPFVNINFWGLCSGENLQTLEDKLNLSCYYDHKSHPAFYINPLKIEVLSEIPPVIQIYDVLGDKMIQEVKIKADQFSLTRSAILGFTSATESTTKARTSVNAWVDDDDIPNLTKKVELMTGLKLIGNTASEKLQVVEYVFGRYYTVHTDPLEGIGDETQAEEQMGDRVATFLFYLNDVEAGGYTPFCNAGTYALPVKGSAIFWFNMYRNGTLRRDTWHGSCPVLYGHKIVANKWIRYNDQFQTFKCTLNQNE